MDKQQIHKAQTRRVAQAIVSMAFCDDEGAATSVVRRQMEYEQDGDLDVAMIRCFLDGAQRVLELVAEGKVRLTRNGKGGVRVVRT